MQKKSTSLLSLFLLVIIVVGLSVGAWSLFRFRSSTLPSRPTSGTKSLQVMAAFYPLFYFAHQIAGPQAEVINITPAGSEPHDYEPTPQQLVQIENSQLLLLNGQGFEPWAERLSQQLTQTQTQIVSTSQDITAAKTDPHVWLSPRLAQAQVAAIAQGLITVDPEHRTDYQQRALGLTQQLTRLDLILTESF